MPGAKGKHRHRQATPQIKEAVVEPTELTALWLKAHFCDFAALKQCSTRHHGLIRLTADGQMEWVSTAYNLGVTEERHKVGAMSTFHRMLSYTWTPNGKKSRPPVDLANGQAGVAQARAASEEIYFLVHPNANPVPA
jgi:hypothetical protein